MNLRKNNIAGFLKLKRKIKPKLPNNNKKNLNDNRKIEENKNKLITTGNTHREEYLNKLEEMLVQERQEYSNLFNQCPEALVYTDVDGIIKYSSEQFENLTGYKSEEIRGDSIFYCLKPIDRDSFNMANKRDFETTIFGRNNTPIEVSIRKNSNQINNRIAGIIFSFQEISRQKRESKVVSILYNISRLAHMDIPLHELYPLLHEKLSEIIDATNFYIALENPDDKKISFPYYTDEAAGDNEIFINRYCTSQSIFHYVLKVGKPVFMDFQRYRKMLSYGYIEPWDVMTNTHLWLAVPLKIEQKVIGVIALQSYDNARLYREKDISILEYISQQLASALYRKIVTAAEDE